METQRFIRTADRASIAYAAVFFLTVAATTFATDGIVFGPKGVIGGDFLAFHTAGTLALQGEALSAYHFPAFDAALKARAPLPMLGMMWQYPPAMFFIAAPFALLPYKVAYLFWIAAGWAALGLALRNLGFRGATFRILLFSPLCVSILSHGQISHLTAGLLFLAAFDPKRRWLVAGVAAGLLTIKPQLGLLLPFAFLAVGAWRTIVVACATAVLIHLPSLLVFGIEGWRAFFDAVLSFRAEIAGAAAMTPPRGMTTVFGQLKLMGAPGETALAVQYAATAALAALTVVVYRKAIDPLAKAAFLGAGAILAAPYAYGYEMTALTLAGAWLAARAGALATPLGAALIGAWALIAARPFTGELPMLNTAFAVSVTALGLMLAFILKRDVIDRAPAPA